jgi:type II secretory pathway predicted ATPase ExeA
MSSPIERFLEKVRSTESRGQREVVLTLTEARDLHLDLTRLLLRLENKNHEDQQNITIEMRGGDF